jgi:hypothetical protein
MSTRNGMVVDVERQQWMLDRYVPERARMCRECHAWWWPERSPVHRAGCAVAEVRMAPR